MLFPLVIATAAAAAAAPLPPVPANLLFVIVDDLRAQAGAYGQATLTPAMDALAARGVTFTRAYCAVTVCSPSRTALLTGVRPDANRLWTIGPYFRDTAPQGAAIVTLPQALRARGAAAAGAGKVWHPGVSSGGDPAWGGGAVGGDDGGYSWDYNRSSGVDPRLQFYECDAWMNSTGQSPRSAGIPDGAGCVTSPDCVACLVAQNGTDGHAVTVTTCADACYVDSMIASYATGALAAHAGSGAAAAPWSFFMGLKRPHLGFQVPAHAFDLYPADQRIAAHRAPPPGFPPAGWWRNGEMDGLADTKPFVEPNATFPGMLRDAAHARLRRAYYASVTWMDSQLGRVLAALDDTGLAASTWVVLCGDHGWSLGEHGNWAKQQLWENVARVPLIIAPPRGAAGWRTNATVGAADGFVGMIDLFPTLAELLDLGAAVPAGQLAGTSLVPHLRAGGRAPPLPAAAFSQIVRGDRNCTPPQAHLTPEPRAGDSDPPAPPAPAGAPPCAMGMSVRTAGWRYTRWTGYDYGQAKANATWGPVWDDVRGEELYSHAADDAALDPLAGTDFDDNELVNLAGNATYAAVKAQLAAQLRAAFPPRSAA